MPLPLTQTQIADTLGLTPIHTNRVLRRLVRAGLLEMNRQWIRFLAPDRLAEMCDFDPGSFTLASFRIRLARRCWLRRRSGPARGSRTFFGRYQGLPSPTPPHSSNPWPSFSDLSH